MTKLTFKRQCWLSVALILIGCLLATFLKQGVFENIAWVLIGLLYIFHPVVPESFKWRYSGDEKRMQRDARIAGAIAILIGLITRFGV